MATRRPTHNTDSRLWSMTSADRVEAMRDRRLSFAELCEWSRRAPHEVPLIGGEFEWIALTMPEAAD